MNERSTFFRMAEGMRTLMWIIFFVVVGTVAASILWLRFGTRTPKPNPPRAQEIMPVKDAGKERRSLEVYKATASIYNPHKCEVNKEQSGQDPSLYKILFRFSRGIIVMCDGNLVTFFSPRLRL